MKKLFLGIFACCFAIAMNAAESGPKSVIKTPKQAQAFSILASQLGVACTSDEQSPTTAAFHGTGGGAASAGFGAGQPARRGSVDLDKVADRDEEDDRGSVGGGSVADGYESEGSTFEDDKHLDPLEYLCPSTLRGGFGMSKLDAWNAVRNKQTFKVSTGLTTSATKRAKCKDTRDFVEKLLPDLSAVQDPKLFETILSSIYEKSPLLLRRNLLSGIRDAALRHEASALAAALEAEKAALAQAERVAKIEADLKAAQALLIAAQTKTFEHNDTLAQRESVTNKILTGMRKPVAAKVFTPELTEPIEPEKKSVEAEVVAFASDILSRKAQSDTFTRFTAAVGQRQALVKAGGELPKAESKPAQLK